MNDTILEPWNEGVKGEQVPPLINSNAQYIRVEAGPGTGKTFGLIRRVERILHPNGLNVPGEEVLVVAFNRVIAQQLNSEISERLEASGFEGQGPVIRTIHSLCISVAGAQRLLMPHEVEAMIYDVMTSCLEVKNTYQTHARAAQALRDHEAKHVDHPELWLECVKWLHQHAASLISDLPRLLLDRLRSGDLPDYRYSHIIVDEFQDLTPGEQELIIRLLKVDGCLTALGDPRQSIYHFRGNEPQGLSKLEELTDSTITDIPITECQRCPVPIVEAANRLMLDHSSAAMEAVSTVTANNHVVVWPTHLGEIKGMAKAIVQNIASHPKDRHLIMVTRRAYGYWMREELSKLDSDLNVNVSFSESVLETWPAREAFLFFCLLTSPDPATWRAWFAYKKPGGDGIFKAPGRNSKAYLSLLSSTQDDITESHVIAVAKGSLEFSGTGKSNILERAARYLHLLEKFKLLGPDELIASIFNDSEEWGVDSSRDPDIALTDLHLLSTNTSSTLKELEPLRASLSDEKLLIKITNALRGQIAKREPLAAAEGPKVSIATLWSAKGVTAEHVYVLGLNDEMIPGNRKDDYPGTDSEFIAEKKRLFYVTITRAKETLVLSRSQKIKFTDARDIGIEVREAHIWPELQMSRFLRQIIQNLPDGVQGADWPGC